MQKICSLCQLNEANKKNTHYLTDKIIRSALNQDGSNTREKGFNFTFDSSTPFVEFNFQRIDEDTLFNEMGRHPTEREIEDAKQIPYSVDYVFCKTCEDKFTHIENAFIQNILPKLRDENLSGLSILEFDEVKICRHFFYIQVFRSAVVGKIDLAQNSVEKLRDIINNNDDDRSFPLKIMYLETLGEESEYTRHVVGFTDDKNPYVIYLNDFILQICEENSEISFLEIYGLSNLTNFQENFNNNESKFVIEIISNQNRNQYIKNIATEQINRMIEKYQLLLESVWKYLFNQPLPSEVKYEFYNKLIDHNDFLTIKFSKEEMLKFITTFLLKYTKKSI